MKFSSLQNASDDRITLYSYAYSTASSSWSFTKTTQVFTTLGNGTNKATTSVQTRLTGFSNAGLLTGSVAIADVTTTDPSGRTSNALDYVLFSSRQRGRHTTIGGASQQGATTWQDGYLMSDQSVTGVKKTYTYGDDGLLAGITEGNGAGSTASTDYLYYTGTKYLSSVMSSTDGGTGTATTTYFYTWAPAKPNAVQTHFNGHDSYTEYNTLGLPIHIWGDGVQPAQIDYDTNGLGRRTKLTTWQSGTFTGNTWPSPGGGNATTWTLDNATGAIKQKQYPDLSHVDFTYNARGQLATRVWARTPLITTTYKYYGDTGVSGDATGELQKIDYSDSTQDVTFTYTRFGTIASVLDAAGTRTLAYNADLTPSTETFDASFYGSSVLTNTYDTSPAQGRPTGWNFKHSGTTLASATIGYDAVTSRPGTVTGVLGTSTSVSFALTYDGDGRADWVKTAKVGTTFERDTPLRAGYDVIDSVTTKWNSGSPLGDFAAKYDLTTGRRSEQDFKASDYSSDLGPGAVNVSYGYDSYGQLTSSGTLSGHTLGWNYDLAGNRALTNGETETGVTATSYTATSLNEYSMITGGRAEPGLTTDPDGNLTHDSSWAYTYDGENRLIHMSNPGSGQTLDFKYDYLGRRIQKTVKTGATTNSDTKFLWSGWNLIAEVDPTSGYTVNRTFVWGPDFSSALGNAGGAGSLLGQIDTTNGITYAVTDTFGTAVGYLNSSGALAAAVEYTPFGKGLGVYYKSGGGYNLSQFPIGYHGKYVDWETGLVYYGNRYYWPKHGRFINRDPIEEAGGNNLFAFVSNTPVNGWDVLGLCGNPGEPPCPLGTQPTYYVHPDPADTAGTDPEPWLKGDPTTSSSGSFVEFLLDDWTPLQWVPTPMQITLGQWADPDKTLDLAMKARIKKWEPTKDNCNELRAEYRDYLAKAKESVDSPEAAMMAATLASAAQTTANDAEYQSVWYQTGPNAFGYSIPVASQSPVGGPGSNRIPSGATPLGVAHSHDVSYSTYVLWANGQGLTPVGISTYSQWGNTFSPGDISIVATKNLSVSLHTPANSIRVLTTADVGSVGPDDRLAGQPANGAPSPAEVDQMIKCIQAGN